jgi:hypothetical protein
MFKNFGQVNVDRSITKRRDRPYRSERSPDWIKDKDPDAPAATRLIEGWAKDKMADNATEFSIEHDAGPEIWVKHRASGHVSNCRRRPEPLARATSKT